MTKSTGIHHITAITGDPQANLDFYEGFLGQKLIKQTINFDDPSAYHFYFADRSGTPGTVLTFFYWKDIPAGTRGTGEVSAIAYKVSPEAISYWEDRASEFDVACEQRENEFGETVLSLEDPDGLTVELVAVDEQGSVDHWDAGPIPAQFDLHGFRGVTAAVVNPQDMEPVLEHGLGFEEQGTEGMRTRFVDAEGGGIVFDLVEAPSLRQARQGTGSVHHVAFRAADEDAQTDIRTQAAHAGANPTPVIDRNYFKSVYFMTPEGVLFEVATDGPGFTIDESVDDLGEHLQIPDEFEAKRAATEEALPPITLPRHKDNE